MASVWFNGYCDAGAAGGRTITVSPPVAPVWPVLPVAPVVPVMPVLPVLPVLPDGPAGPAGPGTVSAAGGITTVAGRSHALNATTAALKNNAE